MDSLSPIQRLVIAGLDHASAPASLREALIESLGDGGRCLAAMKQAGFPEVCLLVTCDRIEAVALTDGAAANDSPAPADRLLDHLARAVGLEGTALKPHSVTYRGEAALRHLFAVASSLESQVLGEPEVLGQVKDCHRLAIQAGTIGPGLEGLLQATYACAKRVRSETSINEGPISLAAAALRLARRLHGDLSRCRALILGLGEMSEVFAHALAEAGVADLALTHPSAARVEAVAHRWRAHHRPWEGLAESLAEADIVIASAGTGRILVTGDMVAQALKRRRRRPIFLVDAAVPGDIEPAVEALDDAFVYDLAELEAAAEEGRQGRESAASAARAIVEEELAAVLKGWAERGAVPAVTAFRAHVESLRREVLTDGRLDAEAATRLLVNRLLHVPSEVLREKAASGAAGREELERSLNELFRMQDGESVKTEEQGSETDRRRSSGGGSA